MAVGVSVAVGVEVEVMVGVKVGVELGVINNWVCVNAAFAVPAMNVPSAFGSNAGAGVICAAPQASVNKASAKSNFFMF